MPECSGVFICLNGHIQHPHKLGCQGSQHIGMIDALSSHDQAKLTCSLLDMTHLHTDWDDRVQRHLGKSVRRHSEIISIIETDCIMFGHTL